MQLIIPCAEYEKSYRGYVQELNDEDRYPFPLAFDHTNFDDLIAKLERYKNGIDLPDEFVPSSTFWLVDEGEIIGISNLRHYLNDRIRLVGGHIGLGVRPSRRGNGLGKQLLKATIVKAIEMGINKVHIHCHKQNEPSVRMIKANGGWLESEIDDDGKIVQRYVVNAP